MEAIKTYDLSKYYGKRAAVKNLNLSVEKGQFISLLGQNGAGKTTTIKMLCCLVTPSSGSAQLLGDDITKSPMAVKQKINVSPQETAIAPNLTVEENLIFIARLYGSSKSEAKVKASEYMQLLNLTDRGKDKAKTLSGGLMRRLSIAMALITEPKILFLDEPTLGLDVRARRDLWSLIKKLKDKANIVLTTHYLEEAEALSDNIAIIHDGQLRAQGTAQQLIDLTQAPNFEEAFLKLTDEKETV